MPNPTPDPIPTPTPTPSSDPTTTTQGHLHPTPTPTPRASTRNPSQDAYETLMELLTGLGVTPTYARVDWATHHHTAPVLLGRLTLTDVHRLNRALTAALDQRNPPSLLADRPHRPLTGETVLDLATDRVGEFIGCLLRPLEPGELWTADPDDIRRPDRDQLIKARMFRRATAIAALVPVPARGLRRD
ncbi:hypothetical protein AB0D49_01040 [Streptomyces sp. NPDC048290]|uniref:hypothetical protein n=1 Tax=Streptomyces sp. NPDC048290 TaxID=3155811 RepID=UPI0034317580